MASMHTFNLKGIQGQKFTALDPTLTLCHNVIRRALSLWSNRHHPSRRWHRMPGNLIIQGILPANVVVNRVKHPPITDGGTVLSSSDDRAPGWILKWVLAVSQSGYISHVMNKLWMDKEEQGWRIRQEEILWSLWETYGVSFWSRI